MARPDVPYIGVSVLLAEAPRSVGTQGQCVHTSIIVRVLVNQHKFLWKPRHKHNVVLPNQYPDLVPRVL